MNKLIVIGIDGMDSRLVDRFLSSMPNLGEIKRKMPRVKMESVFPPDTTPAWASIYTGLNPASHGIINFVNIADKSDGYKPFQHNDQYLRGRTFWDIANKHSRKVCVVLPSNIYPGWPVKGVMICRGRNQTLSAFPKSALKGKYAHLVTDLNLIQKIISKKQLPELIELSRRRTIAEANMGLEILQNEDWELFFIYFSALDAVQHYFWSYFDENHPDFPADNPYKSVIRDFYILIDEIVGRFLASVDSRTSLMIISDHGHGARPYRLLNMNEVLRKANLLVTKSKKNNDVNKRIKTKIVNLVKTYGAGTFLMKLSKRFPVWKRLLAPSSIIDWERTLAYVTDLSTVKSYSYGGIRINREIDGVQYEDLMDRILEIISEIREPITSDELVKWACRREDLYKGPHIDKYPDVVLELKEGYGLGWSVNGPLFSIGDFYKIQPGSHKMHSACFLTSNIDKSFCPSEMTLTDVAPMILRLLGVERGITISRE